jgi:hypothetical protein
MTRKKSSPSGTGPYASFTNKTCPRGEEPISGGRSRAAISSAQEDTKALSRGGGWLDSGLSSEVFPARVQGSNSGRGEGVPPTRPTRSGAPRVASRGRSDPDLDRDTLLPCVSGGPEGKGASSGPGGKSRPGPCSTGARAPLESPRLTSAPMRASCASPQGSTRTPAGDWGS